MNLKDIKKDNKGILQITLPSEILQFRQNYKLPKPMQYETGSLNRSITNKVIKFIVKTFWKISLQAQIASLVNSIKHLKKKKPTDSTQSLPKNRRVRNTFQPILWSQHYSDTKTRQRWYSKETTDQFLSGIDTKILNN